MAQRLFGCRGEGATKIKTEHSGRGHFAVWSSGDDTRDLSFNKTGAYSGTARAPRGLFFLEVLGEGDFEITVQWHSAIALLAWWSTQPCGGRPLGVGLDLR